MFLDACYRHVCYFGVHTKHRRKDERELPTGNTMCMFVFVCIGHRRYINIFKEKGSNFSFGIRFLSMFPVTFEPFHVTIRLILCTSSAFIHFQFLVRPFFFPFSVFVSFSPCVLHGTPLLFWHQFSCCDFDAISMVDVCCDVFIACTHCTQSGKSETKWKCRGYAEKHMPILTHIHAVPPVFSFWCLATVFMPEFRFPSSTAGTSHFLSELLCLTSANIVNTNDWHWLLKTFFFVFGSCWISYVFCDGK